MNTEQFNQGKELVRLIYTTSEAIKALKEMLGEPTSPSDLHFKDNIYFLHVSKHSDGNGNPAQLCRHFGNRDLVEVMIKELEDQLESFNKTFEEL